MNKLERESPSPRGSTILYPRLREQSDRSDYVSTRESGMKLAKVL